MSGFERSDGNSAWTDAEGEQFDGFPEDFSPEEAAFAGELRELFALEREQLPPLYVQTLLEDARHAPAEHGYEQKLTYRVFQRLQLARMLLPEARRQAWRPRPLWANLRETLLQLSRPAATVLGGALLLMVVTVFLAGSSFAAGLEILIGNTGVVQVQRYPTNVHASPSPSAPHASTAATPLLTFDPSMPLAWLGSVSGDYAYAGTELQAPQYWTQGPMVELHYELARSSLGTGLLDIREFRVNPKYAAVLQVVQAGYATPASVSGASAVYVDGTWVAGTGPQPTDSMGKSPSYVWQSGVRSELIFERSGVVFWMVGDQRDGMGENALLQLAQSFVPVDARTLQPSRMALRLAGDSLSASFREPAGHELYLVLQQGTSSDTGTGAFVVSAP